MLYLKKHLLEHIYCSNNLDLKSIFKIIQILKKIKKNKGNLYILGVGGSAGNASHAVNDFRKICNINAFAPTDNISEITARTNDEGWESVFCEWLKVSRLNKKDGILIFSVGGGDIKKKVSVNLIKSIKYAKKIGASIMSIVGKPSGFAAKNADVCCIIPIINQQNITPHTEAFQSVIWHMLVSHPGLKVNKTKW